VLDFLMRKANSASDAAFDLLQDLSLFKPNQALVYDGVTVVELRGDRTIELQTYAQTGQGVLPIHYLLDEQRRPQLVTNGRYPLIIQRFSLTCKWLFWYKYTWYSLCVYNQVTVDFG